MEHVRRLSTRQQCSFCLAVNFFINDTNVKVLDKITSKGKHIGQNGANLFFFFLECRMLLFVCVTPETRLSSLQFSLLSSKDSSLMAKVSIAEHAGLYSLHLGGEVWKSPLVPRL